MGATTANLLSTRDAKPIRQPFRRLPLAKRTEAEQIIQEMERDGVIESSNSPINQVLQGVLTKKDSYSLPQINDTLYRYLRWV